MAKLTQDEILAYLDEATILELNELVKAIEEKYGVSAAAPVAVAAAADAGAAAEPSTVSRLLEKSQVLDLLMLRSLLMAFQLKSRRTLLLKKLLKSRRSLKMQALLLKLSN